VAPASGTGTEGDFYINTTESKIYGPKVGTNWGAGTSLKAPKAPPAPTAKTVPLVPPDRRARAESRPRSSPRTARPTASAKARPTSWSPRRRRTSRRASG
jgi:hypothetical protein